MGLQPICRGAKNALPWLDEILYGIVRANFCESRATEESRAATQGTWDEVWEAK